MSLINIINGIYMYVYYINVLILLCFIYIDVLDNINYILIRLILN